MPPRREALLAVLIFAVGFTLRVENLDRSTYAHPENYVPGYDDPAWVTAPPAKRSTFKDVAKANLADGHPPLWFFAMLPWVKATGTSLEAMRLPSAISGAFCILLLWRLARREGGPLVGLLAAALLAVHGHHVFWSRMARMYAPACLLALLSTWALVRLIERPERRFILLYIASGAALLWTQIYGFPLVAAQGAFVVATALDRRAVPRAAVGSLAAVAVLGAPVLTLAVYQNPPTAWADPAIEHLAFGFAFYRDANFFGSPPFTAPIWPLVGVTTLLLAAAVWHGLRRDPARAIATEPQPQPRTDAGRNHGPPPTLRALLAAGARDVFDLRLLIAAIFVTAAQAAFVQKFGSRTAGPESVLIATCFGPAVLLATAPVVHAMLAAAVNSGFRGGPLRAFASASVALGLIPWGLMVVVSLERPSFVARGAVLFLPFLLAAVALGAATLVGRGSSDGGSTRAKTAGSAIAVLLLLTGAASYVYFRHAEASPRDYRTLAAEVLAAAGPNDLILVQGGYADPPLLYYLASLKDRVVPLNALTEIAPDADRRNVFMVVYDGDPIESDETPALVRRPRRRTLEAHRAIAVEFGPR